MSNEVLVAADGHVYEGIGIPPQVEVPVFIPGNIYPGLKQAVDKAVFLAEKAIAKKPSNSKENSSTYGKTLALRRSWAP
jgi:hypothetical protein